MSAGEEKSAATSSKADPGDGIRKIRTTNIFRAVNFELYAKPVSVLLVVCFCSLVFINHFMSSFQAASFWQLPGKQ